MGEVNRNMRNKKFAQRSGLPRRMKDMSKEQLEAALLKKKECNTRALIIVERLLENTVSEDWFLECLKFISDNHFQDIIEERVILRFCGYPLCHQRLKNIPTQQYRISTRLNKVYDISERKNFCSNQCYKAGKYIKDQLLTSPLWLRDKEEIPIFKVLPVGTSGTGAGEEVDFGQNNNSLKDEVAQLENESFTSVAQFAQNSLSRLSKKIDKLEKKERENKRFEEMTKSSDKAKECSVKEKKSVRFEDKVKNPVDNRTDDDKLDLALAVECKLKLEDTISTQKVPSSNDEEVLGNNNIPVESSNVNTATSANVSSPRSECENTKEKTNEQRVVYENKIQIEQNNVLSDKHLSCNSSQQILGNQSNAATIDKYEKETAPSKTKKTKEKKCSKSKLKNASSTPPITNSIIHIEKCLHEWFTLDSMCFLFGEEKVKEMVVDKGECINEYYKTVGSTTRDAAIREKYEAICRRLNLIELEENKFDAEARQLKPLPDYTAIRVESKKMEIKVRAFYQGKTDIETPPDNLTEVKKEEEPSTILPLVDLHAQNALRRRIMLDRLNRILPDLLRTFGMTSRDVTTDLRALFCTFTLAAHNITFKPAEWNLIGLIIIKMLSIRDLKLKVMLDTDQGSKYQTMMLMAFNQDGGYLERLMAWLTDIDNILQKQPLSKASEQNQIFP